MLSIAPGCARIAETVRLHDEPKGVKTSTVLVAGSRRFEVMPDVAGTDVRITVTQTDRCATVHTPYVHREKTVERKAHPSPGLFLGGGAAAIAIGALSFFSADALAAPTTDPNTGMTVMGQPVIYQALGGILAAAGLTLVLIGIIDAVRAMDSVDDLGLVALRPDQTEAECNVRKTANALAFLRLGGGRVKIRSKTSATGTASFSMTDVAADDLPSDEAPPSLDIQGEILPVPLNGDAVARLRRALEADPGSRAAHDLSAERVRECNASFRLAATHRITPNTDETSATQASADWQKARSVCGDGWSADQEQVYERAKTAIADNLAARARRRCQEAVGAVLEAVRASSEEAATSALSTAKEACSEDETRGVLANAEKAVANLVEERRRSAAMAGAKENVLEALERNDDRKAKQMVNEEEGLASVLRADGRFKSSVIDSFNYWLSQAGGDAQRQIACGRDLYQRVLGRTAWGDLVRGVVEHLGANDPVRASKLVKQINAGSCR